MEERHNKRQKKDRIYVFTDKFVCENCKDWYEHIDPLDSPNCNECDPLDFPHLSRQEAIKRIAKALCADDVMREGYYQMAEAALNALLEKK